uniref:dTDP-4-dehydrorhamnose 3,5-epimerase n=1 Tax=uncultured Elusimicrobia bacterium TaxID=699876 RepID=A0A650EM21_9BACT|nr:dTDP-4-dehydrorhamnose 3,5-epimerase [uncultured Elusimicrobia bacterium]
MDFFKAPIEGLVVLTPRVFTDNRGYFFESYNKRVWEEAGITADFVQDNESYSSQNTLRGLHFQKPPFAQAKLVRVLEGAVWDVAVDLRQNSPTFGKWFGVELSADNKKQFFIPRGFAHGFSVLTPTAKFAYKCDNFYNKESEGAVRFDDPELAVDWKIDLSKAVLSDKDLNNPLFAAYKENPCF